ncbi:MAG TPA: phage major capsid protein [Polyangiaceae bacterium]|jgi:hypothetical protein
MAGETSAAINSALSTTFSRRLRRQWNRAARTAKLIRMVPARGQGFGKQIGWDVAFSGAAANNFQEGSAIGATETAQDINVPAVLGFGMYRSAFQLSNLEVKQAKASIANAVELGRIVVERLDGSLTKIASAINADIFSGTGSGLDYQSNPAPNIVGLTTALAASGAYAGISKATFSEWAGNVLGNGGVPRPLTQDLLYNADQLIFNASGKETQRVIVADSGSYRKYAGLFETIKRVVVGPNGEVPRFEGGARELSWNGMPVLRDRNAETGTLKMLTLDDLELNPLVDVVDEDLDGLVKQAALPSSNGEETDELPIMVDVYPLGRVGSSIEMVAEVYIQLKVERINSHCIIQDIQTT